MKHLPPTLYKQIKGNIGRAKTEELTPEKMHSTNCLRLVTQLQNTITFLSDMSAEHDLFKKGLRPDISKFKSFIDLVRGIDITLSDNTKSLLMGPNGQTMQRKIDSEIHCNHLLRKVDCEFRDYQFEFESARQKVQSRLKQSHDNLHYVQPNEVFDPPPDDFNTKLKNLESELANTDAGSITNCCIHISAHMELFSDPKTGALKKLTAQESKDFTKWSNLLDQAFDRHAEIYAVKKYEILTKSIYWILLYFDKTWFEFSNLNILLKFLQPLGKPHFQKYHPDLTEILISIFTRQLKTLNGIIEKNSNEKKPFKLEQAYKSKLVDAINKLLPDWQSLNNEAYLKLLSYFLIKDDESYWFDLIYTLIHHASSQSHLLSSDRWQQTFLAKLDEHDPDARQMLAAICRQNPSAALQVATNNHRLLWLKAFLCNQAGDHQHAYEAITKVEERCNELGLTPEPRLQLEIVRIKLESLKATANCDGLQPDDLRLIIKQLEKLSAVQEGGNKSNPSALEQLTSWTRQEICQVEQLKSEAQALKKASGRASPPQVQPAQETDEPPVQKTASPAEPPLPRQNPEAICQRILEHLQPRQYCNQAEAMEPDDTFMVMTGNGKPISVTDAMKQDNWNSRIYRRLHEVNNHRSDGDFVTELLTYQETLTDKTNKESIGVHRLILELSWTLMRHADRALGENRMTSTEAGTLLNYAWEFMMQSVHRAMRGSSPLPARLSDKELISRVSEWLQGLEPKAKPDMEFFMRCALGSTAGHINGFRAELFPAKKEHLAQRAMYFFNAKHCLQPGYVKPASNTDSLARSVCTHQSQAVRWPR